MNVRARTRKPAKKPDKRDFFASPQILMLTPGLLTLLHLNGTSLRVSATISFGMVKDCLL
jgi:hypothetical protein